MNELRNRRMKDGESVDAYAGALIELYMKADPLGQYPESDKLQTFLNGLPSQIKMFTELTAPKDFREAWEQAKKVESTLKKDNPFNQDASLHHMNTLVANQVLQLGQSMQNLTTEIRGQKCNLCDKPGHSAENCQQRTMKQGFNRKPSGNCFTCGQSGHWSNQCPQKQQENFYNPNREPPTCYSCGQKGHLSRQCTWKPVIITRSQQQPDRRPPQGGNYQQRSGNNRFQQTPRRVLLNQDYQEPYYEEYTPQQGYYQNPPPVQNYQQPQQQPDVFGALTSAVTQLTTKLENLKE